MKYIYLGGLVILLALSGQVAVAETTTSFDAAGVPQTTTTGERHVACTAEYAPVCGEVEVQCVTTPCDPVQKTYGNSCNLKVAGAKFLYEGECRKSDSTGSSSSEVGGDGEDIGAPTGSSKSNIGSSGEDGVSVEREMKESGEKGGTEDINIGVGELSGDSEHKDWIVIESVQVDKRDLIETIEESSDGGVRAVFIKLGDIKGESKDSSSDDGETEAKSSKPKEIVVVGSKVRDDSVPQLGKRNDEGEARTADSFFDIWIEAADPETATTPDSFFDIFVDVGEERTTPDSFFDIFVDVTDEDLQLQAISIAQADEAIEEVQVLENEVRVVYDEELRLFGVIPINGKRTVVVDTTESEEASRVKVQFPWWHFLATKTTNANELMQNIEEELDGSLPVVPHPIRAQDGTETTDDRPTEEVSFYYNKIQAQTLQTISNISKATGN